MGDKSKLIWRCRRGIREMDIILQDFILGPYDDLSNSDKLTFDNLLDEADLDIYNWLMERDKPKSNELSHIIRIIRDSRKID